jgi:L-histidine Nalpha-methyltransferase
MLSQIQVTIDSSQFPQRVTEALLESLRSRRVNHKFHYDSVKQAQLWLALHEAYSPSSTESDCAKAYTKAFQCTTTRLFSRAVHLIGLGCGEGGKEVRLLQLIQARGKEVFYTPSDVSLALVLMAVQKAEPLLAPAHCFPLVCDLVAAQDLAETIAKPWRQFRGTGAPIAGDADAHDSPVRLFTFFGMVPNFEPGVLLPKLKSLLCPPDYLLLSANLAPGTDYVAGVKHVLPQYDNEMTRDWLMRFLIDLGIERSDGQMRVTIEDGPEGQGLKRIAAYFDFVRQCSIRVDQEQFTFLPGDSIRLFFSYRHIPAGLQSLLARYGFQVLEQWISSSAEEGIFLAKRSGD